MKPSDKLISTLDSLGLYDWHMEFRVAFECCWSGEARLTEETNPEGADVSTALFVAGCGDLGEAVSRLREAVDKWSESRAQEAEEDDEGELKKEEPA